MEKKKLRNSYDSRVGKPRRADSPIGLKKNKINELGKRIQTVPEEKNTVMPETVNAKNNSHSINRRRSTGNYIEKSISDEFYAQFPCFKEYEIKKRSKFDQQKREDYNAIKTEKSIGDNKVQLKSPIPVDQEPEREKLNIERPNIYSPRQIIKDLEETQKRLKLCEETQKDIKEFLKRQQEKLYTLQEKQKTETNTIFRDKSSINEKVEKMKYRAELEKQIEEKRIRHIKQKENFEGDIQREILRTVDFAKEIYGTCSSCSTLVPVEWFSLYDAKLNMCPKCVNKCTYCIPHCDGESSKYTGKRKIFQSEDYDLSLIHEEDLIASSMHRINNLGSVKEILDKNSKLPEDIQRSSLAKKNKINTHTRRAFHELDNRPIFSACVKRNN